MACFVDAGECLPCSQILRAFVQHQCVGRWRHLREDAVKGALDIRSMPPADNQHSDRHRRH
jgi:hypothetical protein